MKDIQSRVVMCLFGVVVVVMAQVFQYLAIHKFGIYIYPLSQIGFDTINLALLSYILLIGQVLIIPLVVINMVCDFMFFLNHMFKACKS